MTLPDRVACCARPCGHTIHRARLALRGDIEWICPEHWVLIPKVTRRTYQRARIAGAAQLGDAIWWWAACRQAAINAENVDRWPIVKPGALCEDGTPPAPTGRDPEAI